MQMQMQMQEHLFFFKLSTFNIHTKKDITVKQWQLFAFHHGLRNRESGNDGKDENVGMLVLRIVTIKYLEVQ